MAEAVRSKLFLPVGALLALVIAAPALAGNGGFAPVPPESPNAEGITQTWWIITGLILGVFVLVEGLLISFVIRYRRRRRARDADGAQIHGSNRLETMWTIGPVLILFAIATVVFVKLPGISNVPAASAGRRTWSSRSTAASTTGSTGTRTGSSRSTPSARRSTARWSCGSPLRTGT